MNTIDYDKYKAVIGLEVHMQLLTHSKNFSNDLNEYGAMPNHNISVITLGHPGTLPKMNKKTVEFAVRLGVAVGSNITENNEFARKNYFYADLPKGYQITQDTTPICRGGKIHIKLKNGVERDINITRIHIEEDAGKSMHDQDPFNTLVDLNRAGVPLLEMVSEPEITSGDEAYQYLTEIRKLVRYLDICDGNMEEGSMRCDANISVMLKDATEFGTKVEVKNMNSIRNVQRAIEHEIKRQIEALETGEPIYQETRSFDAVAGTTASMRSKEMANDYRYFPEPDLQPVFVTADYIQEVKQNLPPLPSDLYNKYTDSLGLSDYDAGVLTDNKATALFFEDLSQHTSNYKAAANWIMGPVKSFLNERALDIERFPVATSQLAALIKLIDDNKVSFSVASMNIFPVLTENPTKNPLDIAKENNWIQETNEDELATNIRTVIAQFPDKVAEYKGGKQGIVGMFMGQVMKLSTGKPDPKIANQMIKEMLDAQ